jgi:hypothetical protein
MQWIIFCRIGIIANKKEKERKGNMRVEIQVVWLGAFWVFCSLWWVSLTKKPKEDKILVSAQMPHEGQQKK